MSAQHIPSEVRSYWHILLTAMIGTGCGLLSITFYTQGLFFQPVTQEFGWTRAEFFTSYMILMLLGVVTGPLVGKLVARFGVRRVGLLGLLGHFLGYLLLAVNPGSLVLWYLSYGALSILAAGSLPITWTALVSQYFKVRLGLAIGITMSGTGVAAALAPLYVRFGLDTFGWRWTYASLGLIAWVMATLVVLAFIRRSVPTQMSRQQAPENQGGLSPSQAYLGYRFWFVSAAVFLISLAVGGLVPNFALLLAEKGVAAADIGTIISLLGVAIIAGRLSAGYLMDRIWAPLVSAIYFSGTVFGIGCLLMQGPLSIGTVGFAAIMTGLALGAELDIIAYITRRYFGSKHYAEIFGGVYVSFAVGVGVAASAWGFLVDWTENYDPILWASIALIVIANVLILLLGRYPVPEQAKRKALP
ncbi:Major facilitator family transporter [Alloalcanivorax dieselolei B5]|uniref:Major facilitator family transporter n=1 Tax=Alcanivorax dieselolei (strain DSM 16502 / CGMCC 1.3690 / MCCC 1A00001 / B-5) TaxID=930169 RepID=K0CEI6_ALCDB|nr:MFS transporter [Alloalcanivorax dieselolei]AFT71053.1 Major facilitator family transporter [Alloalcanivorax dieselolei B5]GGK00460.1 MFS transporter [Alloalcanivorax dieselolei]